jgi:hypothetical protein
MNIYNEIDRLRELQADHGRFFSREEFDLLQEYIKITHINVGDYVWYIPFNNCSNSDWELGKVKDISMIGEGNVRVVYHCDGEWDNWMNYTSALTNMTQLRIK